LNVEVREMPGWLESWPMRKRELASFGQIADDSGLQLVYSDSLFFLP